MNETVNELYDIGNTTSKKTQLICWGIFGGMLTGVYLLGKRSGKKR